MAEDMEEDIGLNEEEAADLAAIRARKKQIVADHRLKKGAANNQAILPQRARAEGRLTTENMKVWNVSRGDIGVKKRRQHAEAELDLHQSVVSTQTPFPYLWPVLQCPLCKSTHSHTHS